MQEGRSLRDYIALSGKGMMMGAADAVPGVSGGTIAFMTGIYEELIYSLKQCGPSALIMLFKEGPVAAWKHVNGTFLLTLISGILFSLLTISHVVLYWLAEYPELLWSFFFGLILASVWSVCRHVEHWDRNTYTSFIIGVITAYFITSMSPTSVEATPLFIFLSGMVAICAMILPGISGSFILVIIGMYGPVLGAIKSLDLGILLFFVAGCVLGLLSVARLITWAFHRFHDLVLAVLTGFMIGALNKVWPWKAVLSWRTNSSGEQVPLNELSLTPFSYADLTGHDPQILAAIGMAIAGFGIVLLIEWAAKVLPNAQKGCSDK
jgi:putative membrane protein